MGTGMGTEEEPRSAERPSLDELAGERDSGLLSEYFRFMAHTRKWWLLPIVVLLALAAGLVILAGTGAAPLIYALF